MMRWIAKNIKTNGWIYLILLASINLLIITNMQIAKTRGTLIIDEIVLTTGIDGSGKPLQAQDQFSVDQERIYCYVSVSSPKPVRVGARWKFEGDVLLEEEALVDQSRAFILEPPNEIVFPGGHYQVEIYLIRKSVKSIDFTIE